MSLAKKNYIFILNHRYAFGMGTPHKLVGVCLISFIVNHFTVSIWASIIVLSNRMLSVLYTNYNFATTGNFYVKLLLKEYDKRMIYFNRLLLMEYRVYTRWSVLFWMKCYEYLFFAPHLRDNYARNIQNLPQ